MDVGRVFYDDKRYPMQAIVVALASHVGNVVALVKAWDDRKAYQADYSQLQQTRLLLITAAERHDEAKPETFRVTIEKDGRWGYSFAGHRFRVPCDDVYVDALIKMHHDFSVDSVAEWQARLRREGGKEWGKIYFQNFPFDLYALEMCDQVAAEVESYAFDGNADERAFMELHSRWRDKANGVVEVEPFPFDPSPLTLTLRYAEFSVADELRNDAKLTAALKEWKPQPAELKERTVTLCSP